MRIIDFNLKKFINKKNFLILFIVSIWLSIDTSFIDIISFTPNLKNILITIRLISPNIFFLLTVFIFFNEIFYI